MHDTEEIANIWFTHCSLACVALALNDRIEAGLARDKVDAMVTLTPRPADRIAELRQTLGAPLLELFGGQGAQLSLSVGNPLPRLVCAQDVPPPQDEDRGRHERWHPQLPKTVDQHADQVRRNRPLEQAEDRGDQDARDKYRYRGDLLLG